MDSFNVIDNLLSQAFDSFVAFDPSQSVDAASTSSPSLDETTRPLVDEDHYGHGGFSAMCIIA